MELTKLTPKGYIKIPEDIRGKLKLKANTNFVIFTMDGTLMLKKIITPSMEDFEEIVDWGTEFAKEKGIKPEDIIASD